MIQRGFLQTRRFVTGEPTAKAPLFFFSGGFDENLFIDVDQFVIVVAGLVFSVDSDNRFDGEDFVSDLQSGNKVTVFTDINMNIFLIAFF